MSDLNARVFRNSLAEKLMEMAGCTKNPESNSCLTHKTAWSEEHNCLEMVMLANDSLSVAIEYVCEHSMDGEFNGLQLDLTKSL